MVILVTGDRHWKNRRKVHQQIFKRRRKVKLLIEGGARGADFMAYECAKLLGIQTCTMEANWGRHHLAAGPIRNKKMLSVLLALPKEQFGSKLVLAFHHNLKKSKGTRGMVQMAKAAGVRVRLIK